MKNKNAATHAFDLKIAREMIDAFVYSTGVGCLLIDANGDELYRHEKEERLCARLRSVIGNQICEKMHLQSVQDSERFGGRYIYFCPMGMGWFASPIILEGKIVGALAAGPVMVMDQEDHVASTPALQGDMSPQKAEQVDELLKRFPKREPRDLNYLSAMLLSTALYIGGERRSLLERRQAQEQYRDIGEYMQQLKRDGVKNMYPLDKERALLQAITDGDQQEAQILLNELLGHILYSTGGDFAATRARALELLALLSRASAEGGADVDQVLALNQRFIKESDYLSTTDQLTVWLNRVIEQYTALVFDLVDVKHKDIIYKSIHYMKRNFSGKLSLEDTARYVGFSPTYFSKVFKDEMGVTFNSYLGGLRVERSKILLLSGELSVGDVCAAVGFDDQSYFIKVFRKYTGVTPGKFRKQQGRLDRKKERDTTESY